MAKSEKQKLKMLYLLKFLMEQTDEDHPLSMQALIKKLSDEGIHGERKSIYNDISYLQEFGIDIVYSSDKSKQGYYVAGRDFELPECKLLVDAVVASKFITASKAKKLIQKLQGLVSTHQAMHLQRQVVAPDRIRHDNESIYYRIDEIHRAIQANKRLSFQYLEWNLKKQLVPRKDGRFYEVSPWALLWNDENYYLVGYDRDAQMIKHFRVDKIGRLMMGEDSREGKEAFLKSGVNDYSTKTFGMYGGTEEKVTIQCPNHLVGVILDRFGKEVTLQKTENDSFAVHVTVSVSSQFFGWMAGVGKDAMITSPESVKEQYRKYLQDILDQMKKKEVNCENSH